MHLTVPCHSELSLRHALAAHGKKPGEHKNPDPGNVEGTPVSFLRHVGPRRGLVPGSSIVQRVLSALFMTSLVSLISCSVAGALLQSFGLGRNHLAVRLSSLWRPLLPLS